MNVFLWVLQILLALHTAMGAVWKLSNAAQTVPSLSAIPHPVWLGLSGVEILCAVGLVLPALGGVPGVLAPLGAAVVAAEMLAFTAVHLASGDPNHGPMVYWLVVAVVCGFLAFARASLHPL
ncbi:MAG: DoxX family protein [Myxococcales bacterium]|nr:DoxX family protein [Myxococcales bacterium]